MVSLSHYLVLKKVDILHLCCAALVTWRDSVFGIQYHEVGVGVFPDVHVVDLLTTRVL